MTELLSILRAHAAQDRVALIEARAGQPPIALPYSALLTYAIALDDLLPRQPSPPIVAILSESPLRQVVAAVAAMASGMIVNIINTALSPAMLRGQLLHAQPDLLIIDDKDNPPPDLPQTTRTIRWSRLSASAAHAAPESSVTHEAGAEEGGLLIYTSGTTGAPKGVMLPWGHIAANVRYAIGALGMAPGWVAGSLLPRFHSFTLISDILPALMLGGRAILVDTFSRDNVAHIVSMFTHHRVLSYSAPATIFESFCLLKAWHKPSSLRFAVAGAAPLRERTRQEYNSLFNHPIIPCYGLTETTCFAAISPPGAIRPHAVGLPAGIEIRVVGDDDESLPCDTKGELVMRGPSVIQDGYFRDAEGRFTASFTSDGWLRTGDIGRIDAAGYIYVTGRKKNMVIRGGNKVYLEDVDRCIADLPGILDCASVALCRPDLADKALTFVVAAGERPARTRINDYIRKTLTHRHVPDRLYFVERIPRTRTGKASIPELLALAQEFVTAGDTEK